MSYVQDIINIPKKSKHVDQSIQELHESYVPGFKINYCTDYSSSSTSSLNVTAGKIYPGVVETEVTKTSKNVIKNLKMRGKDVKIKDSIVESPVLDTSYVEPGAVNIAERCRVGIGSTNNSVYLQCIVVDNSKPHRRHVKNS